MMAEQNKARQMEIADRRDRANDENRDLDRQADMQMEQMRLDRDDMNDAVRMQHERDMQQRDHQSEIVRFAMQVQASKKHEGGKK
jgi:hypothetical protein